MKDELISRQELLDSFAGPKIDYRTDLTLKQVRDIINDQKTVFHLLNGKKVVIIRPDVKLDGKRTDAVVIDNPQEFGKSRKENSH